MSHVGDVSIRSAGPDDAAALALVGQASFLEAFAGVLSGADILAHCANQHSPAKYATYLADSVARAWLAEASPGGGPVGYVLVTKPDLPLPDVTPSDLEVKRVYLLHRFQGLGLGRRLMATAEAHARARGCRRLLLGVYGGNATAIAFYERLGYVRVGTRRFQVGANTYDDLIMALALS